MNFENSRLGNQTVILHTWWVLFMKAICHYVKEWADRTIWITICNLIYISLVYLLIQ